MTTPSKTQLALIAIEKKPGIRTKELAEALDIPTENVLPLLVSPIRRRFVVTCDVIGPNNRKTLEWRLSSAVNAADWEEWKSTHPDPGGKTASLSANRIPPARRQTQEPPSLAKSKLPATPVAEHKTQPIPQALASRVTSAERGALADIGAALAKAGLVKSGDLLEPAIIRLIQENKDQRQRIEQLEARINSATDDTVDVKAVAIGYIVRTPKQKPRICAKPERAVEAAKSAARNHGRSDVLALVPVGTARGRRNIHVDYTEA